MASQQVGNRPGPYSGQRDSRFRSALEENVTAGARLRTRPSLVAMDTWTTRELPVLRALVTSFEDVETSSVRIETLVATSGLDEKEVQRALRALSSAEPPYVIGQKPNQVSYPIVVTEVTERARRAVGQWPTSDLPGDVLLAALRDEADREPDETKRSRLRRAADALGAVGSDVVTKVLAEILGTGIEGHMPHHL